MIDKFVFDPQAARGEMAVSLGKGVLRVVGGQATHTGGATISTPWESARPQAAEWERRRESAGEPVHPVGNAPPLREEAREAWVCGSGGEDDGLEAGRVVLRAAHRPLKPG